MSNQNIIQTFDINDLYVGELFISTEMPNLLEPNSSINKKDKDQEYIRLISKGAIQTGNGYYDHNIRNKYRSLLTIFLSVKDKMLCLHNGEEYEFEGEDYCQHLQPITKFLQLYDQEPMTNLNLKKALFIFRTLFKNGGPLGIAKNRKLYSLDNFYIGQLNLVGSRDNISERMILDNHAVYSGSFVRSEDKMKFDTYKTLFLITADGLCCLHNNVVYHKMILNHQPYNDETIKESFCDWLVKIKECLNNQETKNNSMLTIEQARTLYKKL